MTCDLASAEEVQSPTGFELASAQSTTRQEIRRVGEGPWDAWVAGWQGSATGLLKRQRLPDIVLDSQHAKWYEHAISGISGTVSDIPEMVAGGIAGAAAGGAVGSAVPVVGTALGGILGAGAGIFAVPTAIRESLIQAYQSREADSSKDFLDRAGIVINETAKSSVVGTLTVVAGAVAGPTARPARVVRFGI